MTRSVRDGAYRRAGQHEDTRERRRVADAARELRRWARGHPQIHPGRAYSAALGMGDPIPCLDAGDLVAITRGTLWIFAFDDLVDEGDLAHEEVRALADRYTRVALGEPADRSAAADPLAGLLRDVCDGLAGYRLFGPVRHIWARALGDTLDAMAREHLWRQRHWEDGSLPAYRDYVDNGCRSIAGAPYIWMALIVLGEPSAVRHAGHLAGQMRQAALCIRLANDLRSYLKELAEGNINSVTLHTADALREGRSYPEAVEIARQRVEREIDEGLAVCERNAGDVRTDTGHPERVIADIAHWTSGFYRRHGYLTYRPGGRAAEPDWSSRLS